MKNILHSITISALAIVLWSCNNSDPASDHDSHGHAEGEDQVQFSTEQFKALTMQVDTLRYRSMNDVVEANGQLEVPPQNEATVTAVIGGNIASINVIEGDEVRKGQVLAYLSHPSLVKLQTNYLNELSRLQFLEKEYYRQKRLYENDVASGKDFQKIQSEYEAVKGQIKGIEAELKLLNINASRIRANGVIERVPVLSPIKGHINKVEVKTGQYVEPQTDLFEVVNIHHIHADLMVFEKDIHKVKKGQKVRFKVASLPDKELEAIIYSVGKTFEQDPKALHIHAEIENKEGLLIPGMYVQGQIITNNIKSIAIPEEAIVTKNNRQFIFAARQNKEANAWIFRPVEVLTGIKNNGWVEVNPLDSTQKKALYVWNNAYYILAEMDKREAGHSH